MSLLLAHDAATLDVNLITFPLTIGHSFPQTSKTTGLRRLGVQA
jgi:hypothetical protein